MPPVPPVIRTVFPVIRPGPGVTTRSGCPLDPGPAGSPGRPLAAGWVRSRLGRVGMVGTGRSSGWPEAREQEVVRDGQQPSHQRSPPGQMGIEVGGQHHRALAAGRLAVHRHDHGGLISGADDPIELPGLCLRCRFGEGSNGRRAQRLGAGRRRQGSYIVRLRSFYALEIRKSTQTGQVFPHQPVNECSCWVEPGDKWLRATDGLRSSSGRAVRRSSDVGASLRVIVMIAWRGVRCRQGAVVIGADAEPRFGSDALRVRRRPRITSHSPSRSSPMKVKVAVSVQWPGESTAPKVSTT